MKEVIDKASKSGSSVEYKWIPRGLMREQIKIFQGWTHCVRYDKRLGKAVGIVMAGEEAHTNEQPWYRVTIDDNDYMSDYEEIIVYDTDGSTQITPDNGYICGFCILSDGTYLMQDISFNFYKSTDYGKTLTKITSSGHPTQAFGMRQLSTGRIISGCVSGYNRFYCSDDLGTTWKASNVCDVSVLGNPPFEADSKYEFSEHCIVEFSNGTLLAIGRTSNNARDTSGTVRGHLEGAAVAYSDDKGTTWRDFGWSKTITNMTSNNASCVCIDGIYHLVMGDRYTYTTDEQGNRKYFAMYYQYATEEDALNDNWSEPVVIDYGHWTADATTPTDSGYPSLWKDSEDNLHCVFYDGDGSGHAYGANWRLIDGSPVVESRAVSGEGNGSLIVSYSQAQVDAMLSAQMITVSKKLSQLSNPNLLINSDFRNPINQRGQTSYVCGKNRTYTIDRWSGWGVTVNVNNGYIQISTNTTNSLVQALENSLPQDKYTLSVKVKSVTGNVKANVYGNVTTEKELSVGLNTLLINDKIDSVLFYLEANSSIELEWVKLEMGTLATPFVPRPITEELMQCQKYYRKIEAWNGSFPLRGDGTYIYVTLPFTMRVSPTVIDSSLAYAGLSSVVVYEQTIETVKACYKRNNTLEIVYLKGNNVVNFGVGVISKITELDAEIY